MVHVSFISYIIFFVNVTFFAEKLFLYKSARTQTHTHRDTLAPKEFPNARPFNRVWLVAGSARRTIVGLSRGTVTLSPSRRPQKIRFVNMFISCPVHRIRTGCGAFSEPPPPSPPPLPPTRSPGMVSIRLISVHENRIRFDGCQKTPADLPCVFGLRETRRRHWTGPNVFYFTFLRFPLEIKSLRTRAKTKSEV